MTQSNPAARPHKHRRSRGGRSLPREGAVFLDAEYAWGNSGITELCVLDASGNVLLNVGNLKRTSSEKRRHHLERLSRLLRTHYTFACGTSHDRLQIAKALKRDLPQMSHITCRYVNIQQIECMYRESPTCLSLKDLAKRYNLRPCGGWHHAVTDARMTHAVYQCQAKEFGFDPHDVPTLLNILAERNAELRRRHWQPKQAPEGWGRSVLRGLARTLRELFRRRAALQDGFLERT